MAALMAKNRAIFNACRLQAVLLFAQARPKLYY